MIALTRSDVAVYYAWRVPALRQRATRWRGRCPIHQGKGYNFSVDPETGLWRCWSGCGCGGDIIALEMALTGAAWREAVAGVEGIVGRVLLDRPASRAERRSLAERREHERGEMRDAELFRITAMAVAEQILEELPEAVPERFGPTQLLLSLRRADGASLLALYRGWREHEPGLAAALVFAGKSAWRRRCDALARFVTTLAGVEDAA
jgi:hypothetical protein